jgi:hypothetical protein
MSRNFASDCSVVSRCAATIEASDTALRHEEYAAGVRRWLQMYKNAHVERSMLGRRTAYSAHDVISPTDKFRKIYSCSLMNDQAIEARGAVEMAG